jgi:RND family efflux transporter MFP subunit
MTLSSSTLLMASLSLLSLSGCGSKDTGEVADQTIRPARIFQVSAAPSHLEYRFVGRVEARQTVDMSFEVSGPMAELPVREGQSIAKGELVAAMDATDYLLALRLAEVQLKLAQQDLSRKSKLLQEQGISQSIVDDAQAQFELREVGVAQASEALDDTRLYAPFDAYVARRFTDNHANIQPGDPVVRLSDLGEIFVIANIPESLLATTTADRLIGAHAQFAFVPDVQFELTYRENTGESNAVAQTYEVTFAMPRPERWNILPGMTATVTVKLNRAENSPSVIEIPTSALVTDANRNFAVWRFDPVTQRVEKTALEIGPINDLGVTVQTGLKDGDLIVTSGANHLRPGMRVRMLGEPIVGH